MQFDIIEESTDKLEDYGTVSIAFRVDRRYRVDPVLAGLGGLLITEEPVARPYIKDYDTENGGPQSWPSRWNTSVWGVFAAYEGSRRVGGAVVAWKTPELVLTGNGAASIVLWDLRVDPQFRHHGLGGRLFGRVLDWGRARSCRRVEVETQNTNVPACRFYAGRGCELTAIHRNVYGDHSREVRLIWERSL
jgi:ribosomal protein S18 acetylase RimI-like enzyme